MENRKLITALIVGCMAFLPAGAAESTISEVIENQIGTGSTPGVATVNAGDTLIIDDATIRNNSGYGGAFVNNGTIHINDGEEGSHTTFSGNSNNNPTMGGGAIYSYTTGSTKVYVGHYTSFENNSSSYTDADGKHGDSGGAIYVGNATLEIGSNVNFSDNEAISGRVEDPVWGIVAYGGHGGAIYAIDSDVTIGNYLKVANNKSIYSGGGAYFHNTSGTHSVTIGTGAIFTGNESLEENGGAIGNKNNTLTIGAGAEFTNNTAAQSGGAIYNTATVNVNGAIFTGNKAKNGGALYNAQNATASLQDVTFSAASGDASNSIYNAGSVTTSSSGANVNLFASAITNNNEWTYGGTNNVSGNIDGTGNIINSGTTTFGGDNSGFTGTFSQTDSSASTTVTGTFFDGTSTISNGTLNWDTKNAIPESGSLEMTSGNLNIGSQNTGSIFTVSGKNTVADAVNININNGSTLSVIEQGAVTLGSGDTWSGNVNLAGGELTVSDMTMGSLSATSGSLNLDNVTLNQDIMLSDNITLGTVSDLTNNANLTNNNSALSVGGEFNNTSKVEGSGNLTVTDGSNTGSISQNSFTVAQGTAGSESFENSTSSSITAGTITNNGSLSNAGTIGGQATEFTNNGEFVNNGTVTANEITNAENATFTNNTANVTAGTFNNEGEVAGTGSLTLGSGTNTGSITQNAITIATGGTYNNGTADKAGTMNVDNLTISANSTLNNYGSIGSVGDVVTSITNSGTFTNNGSGSIYATTITNNEGASFATANKNVVADTFINNGAYSGTGSTEADTGSNNSSIEDNKVTITGTYDNTGSITAKEEFVNSGTITDSNDAANNSSITTKNGSNSGSITQDSVTLTGNFENTGSINAANFTNSGTITDDTGSISTSNGTNTGSITQDAITVAAGGKFTSGAGNDATQASIAVNTLTNGGTVELKNSVLTVASGDVSGTINALGTGNVLNLSNTTGDDFTGTLKVGDGATVSALDFGSGNIVADAVVNITKNSTYDISGGSVVIDGNNDTWTGDVNLTGGTLTTSGVTSNGTLVAGTGTLNIQDNSSINIGSKSSIAANVTTNLESGSSLNINNGGSVTLNSGDTWAGKITLGAEGSATDTSSLDVSGLTSTGTLFGNSGKLVVGSNDLDIQGESYIEKEVAIQTNGNIDISNGGKVAIDDNDTLDASSKVTLSEGGTLDYGKTSQDASSMITATGGNLNLLDKSYLTIDGSSSIADAVALNINNGATLKLDAAVLNLDNADQWNGKIINQAGGTINANGLINNSDTATLEQKDGVLNVYNDAQLTLGQGSFIEDGEINITKGANGTEGSTFTLAGGEINGGDMTIDKDSAFVVKSGTFALNKISGAGKVDENGVMQAALINTANGERVQHSIIELAIDGQTNFNIDIHARGNHYTSNDQFVVGSLSSDGTARIDNWGLNGDIFGWDAPIDRHITLDHIFVDENGNPLQGNIEITRKTEFTPIGYYQLNQKGSGTGLHYTLDLVDFNPQVFRGQVATVAQWMNQLAIDDMLFTHSMVLPSFKEEDGGKAYSGMMVNRYASSNPLFAPYQYSRKDGGLWYKMYGTFENLNMNVSGLGRVGNNAYGALIGADFGLKELKNGWKFMPTAYVGYNGAHQAYPGIGAYQNGGQAGFLGTWYKNNFILGGLVYGGVYENSMDVGGHTDNAFNYFAGAATKLAYNWRFHRDWVLQPNLMAAYNFFGQQNWHSDYGQMGMMAGMLNGVNIAPGVNLIWEKETFSIYGTLQYMYNLNGAVGGRAGNVGLPQVEMERGYIQYGLGFTKRWGDRFSGYLQAVLRNAGRTGVGFQLGFNFLLGK